MANSKTISFVDAVQRQARSDLTRVLQPIEEAMTKMSEVIDVLNKRTLDLHRRVQLLEQRLPPINGGGGRTPQPPDAS